jgi:hypothetical protein
MAPPLELIAERLRYYTDGKRDFVVFQHGTCVLLADGLSDQEAVNTAGETLRAILHAHPDITPLPMKDGNVVVRYSRPEALSVVVKDWAEEHRAGIELHHQEALTPDEVLITPLGPNRFDDLGKLALFGRCFMFMDAQAPELWRIVRKEL